MSSNENAMDRPWSTTATVLAVWRCDGVAKVGVPRVAPVTVTASERCRDAGLVRRREYLR